MRTVWMAAFGLAPVIIPGVAAAQTEAPTAQGDVSVTIYNNNVALVQDRRQLSLTGGVNRQEFPDVSAQIRPETVTLGVDGATIVEQNFDYDLLTPDKLLDKSVGRTITVVRQNPATGAETSDNVEVLANNGGTIIRSGGRIEVLPDTDRRLIFPSLPPNLRARPTLSVTLDAERAGARPATLAYLTGGLSWKADYVALFDEGAGKIDVQGWITLSNNSGTTYSNARTLLVAGAVGQGGNPRGQYQPPRPRQVPGNQPGMESADRERLGDFYLYPITGRTTIANAQQKQVSFLDVSGADASKGYLFRNAWLGRQDDPVSAETILRFSSMSGGGGLGDALPAGTIRVYMRDAKGAPQFIGENQIGHLPMGSRIAMKTGDAFDVKVQPIVEKREKITTDEWERSVRFRINDSRDGERIVTVDRTVDLWRTTMRYVVTNARPAPVTVEVVQSGLGGYYADTRVPNESIKGEQRSLDERAWMVPVPANGETVLTVTFDTRY
ncbi:DUF4139 domain-containing protein [Sphingomonas sp. CJ99]